MATVDGESGTGRRPRWVRGWRALAVAVAVPTLLVGGCQVASVLAREDRVEVVEVAADLLAAVDVRNDVGPTRIVGVPGADTVTVTAEVRDGLRPTGHRVEHDGDRLVVRGSCPVIGSAWCRVGYTISVPPDMAVTARTTGSLAVSDVDAAVDVDVRQGSLELERLGGDVVARAGQGRIAGTDLATARFDASAGQGSIEIRFGTSPHAVSLRAGQGAIDITLPDEEGVDYALDASAGQGSVTTPIRSDPRSDRTMTLRAGQGSITARYG
jgi:hypothetical protein